MFWKSTKGRIDPESAWKLQNQEQKENATYRFINLQKQGRLVEVYTQQGPAACEAVIRSELQSFLYDSGKGKVITKTEYVKWKFGNLTKLNVSQSKLLFVKVR